MDLLAPIEKKVVNDKPLTNKMLQQILIPPSDNTNMIFSVDCPKNFYVMPSNITIGPEPPKELQKFPISLHPSPNKEIVRNYLWLKVKFISKTCMVYEGDITLKNLEIVFHLFLYSREMLPLLLLLFFLKSDY